MCFTTIRGADRGRAEALKTLHQSAAFCREIEVCASEKPGLLSSCAAERPLVAGGSGTSCAVPRLPFTAYGSVRTALGMTWLTSYWRRQTLSGRDSITHSWESVDKPQGLPHTRLVVAAEAMRCHDSGSQQVVNNGSSPSPFPNSS